MSLTANLYALASALPRSEFDVDDDGYVTSANPLLPPVWEIILQALATGIVVGLLVWKAGPMIKKAFRDRTARIQGELDAAAQDKADAEAEATRIRQAVGDIANERTRLLAEADSHATVLLAEGRERIEREAAELEARAEADIVAASSRGSDELRIEIARHAGAAADLVVERSIDDSVRQELIENFIARVGASS
jgi:F-type H+-transporting ATPase subunit b